MSVFSSMELVLGLLRLSYPRVNGSINKFYVHQVKRTIKNNDIQHDHDDQPCSFINVCMFYESGLKSSQADYNENGRM